MRGTVKTVAALGFVALLAAGCAKPSSSSTTTSQVAKFKACMVTDTGGINDKSFNQASWAGVQAAQTAEPTEDPRPVPAVHVIGGLRQEHHHLRGRRSAGSSSLSAS